MRLSRPVSTITPIAPWVTSIVTEKRASIHGKVIVATAAHFDFPTPVSLAIWYLRVSHRNRGETYESEISRPLPGPCGSFDAGWSAGDSGGRFANIDLPDPCGILFERPHPTQDRWPAGLRAGPSVTGGDGPPEY